MHFLVGIFTECPKWTIRNYVVHQTLTHWVHKGCKSSYFLGKSLLCFISDLTLGKLKKKKRTTNHPHGYTDGKQYMCVGGSVRGVCTLAIEPRCSSKVLGDVTQACVPLLRIFPGNKAEEGSKISCLMHTLKDLWARTYDAPANCKSACSWVLGMHAVSIIRSDEFLKRSGMRWFKGAWPPQAHAFECLVSHWWNCLGRVRREGLVARGVTLGLHVEVSFLSALSAFACRSDGSSQLLLEYHPVFLPTCSLPWQTWTLTFWNNEPKCFLLCFT